MPLRVVNIADGNAFAVLCEGVVTDRDVTAAIHEVGSSEDKLPFWRFAIIEMTSTTNLDLRAEEIQSAAVRHENLSQTMHSGLLVAVVAPTDLLFGLSRMWQSFAQNTGWEINVVRSRQEAEAWLRQRAASKFELFVSSFKAA